jgi:hypothetical protein
LGQTDPAGAGFSLRPGEKKPAKLRTKPSLASAWRRKSNSAEVIARKVLCKPALSNRKSTGQRQSTGAGEKCGLTVAGGSDRQQKTPSDRDGVNVEAEGIEPSSQDNPNGSLYMLSLEF